MKVTKKELTELVKQSWNCKTKVYGIGIAVVGWHNNSYKILKDSDSFDDATERTHEPIKEFYYQKEMVNYLYNQIKERAQ